MNVVLMINVASDYYDTVFLLKMVPLLEFNRSDICLIEASQSHSFI